MAASTPRLAATGQIKQRLILTEEDGRRQEEHHGQEIRILLEECYSRFLDLLEMRIDDGGGNHTMPSTTIRLSAPLLKMGASLIVARSTLQKRYISQAQNIMIMTMRSRLLSV